MPANRVWTCDFPPKVHAKGLQSGQSAVMGGRLSAPCSACTPAPDRSEKRIRPVTQERSSAHILVESLARQGVEFVFGYPGGAVLPIYDAIFQQNFVQHVLVRHEPVSYTHLDVYKRQDMTCAPSQRVNRW